jgi:hypothetical protein
MILRKSYAKWRRGKGERHSTAGPGIKAYDHSNSCCQEYPSFGMQIIIFLNYQ